MALSKDEVKHIAKLARLKLSDEEISQYAAQLSGVLEYVEILNELDVSGVEPTYQVTGLANVMREDEVRSCDSPQQLLECSNQPIERAQIKVRSVFE